MALKKRIGGGFVVFVGFMLSPLSWWNDLFVNVPLALVFAWAVSWFYRPAFEAAAVIGYLLTNILGFVLMQKGGEGMLAKTPRPYTRRDFCRDTVISLAYTLVIVLLVRWRVLRPPSEYFHQPA